AAPWRDSPWAKYRVDDGRTKDSWPAYGWSWVSWATGSAERPSTPRQRAVDSLRGWLGDMRHPVQLAFANQARTAPAMTMQWTADELAVPPQLVLRLARLDELKAQRILSDEEYHAQRAIIEAESGHVASGRWTAAGLTNVKAITDELSTVIMSFSV